MKESWQRRRCGRQTGATGLGRSANLEAPIWATSGLNRRLVEIARDFYARPQAQIPQACQSRARTKAAYRFFKHPSTAMDDLLEAAPEIHLRADRRKEDRAVPAGHDEPELQHASGDGESGTDRLEQRGGIIGLIVHDTMAFSVEGTPLGLLDVQCWARDAGEFGKKHQRKQRRIEEKESYKWLRSFQSVAEAQRQCPDTMLVSMGDREADIYELFHLALQDPQGTQAAGSRRTRSIVRRWSGSSCGQLPMSQP